jgi:predicted GIY-YIG superfamily endonuclease
MKYVYLLESIGFPDQTYIGLTHDLRGRLAAHNADKPPTRENSNLGGP